MFDADIKMALSRRHELDPLKEPEYELEDVPRALPTLEGSAAKRMNDREEWIATLAEMVLLTNRAGEEHEKRAKEAGLPLIHPGKALGLEYMADRVDTDDPLWGWTIRTTNEGWLQGYVCVTTFTTWQRWFKWDSLSEAAGVLPVDRHSNPQLSPEEKATQQWWDDRIIDGDGRLARALNRQIRDGDWTDEGVVWPRLAEISLLGGLGCGGLLVDAVIEELSSQAERQYDYIVVQATENAVPFYESRGFVRVGAIARYEQKLIAEEMETKTEQLPQPTKKKDVNAVDDIESLTLQPGVVLTGTSSPCDWIISEPLETPSKIAKRLQGVRSSDIVFLNRRVYPGISENSVLIPGTRLRIPRLDPYDMSRNQEPITPFRLVSGQTMEILKNDARPGGTSSNGHWYRSVNAETIKRVAKTLSVNAESLAAFNRGRYGAIKESSTLQDGTILWIPERALDLNKLYSLKEDREELDEQERVIRETEVKLHQDEVSDPRLTVFYSTSECDDISIFEGKRTKKLSEVVAYRHWTFPDDPSADMTPPSYMMVLPLTKSYLEQHVPSIRKNKRALETLGILQQRTFPVPPYAYQDVDISDLPMNLPAQNGGEMSTVPRASQKSYIVTSNELMKDDVLPVNEPAAPPPPPIEATTMMVTFKSECMKEWRQGPYESGDGTTKVFFTGLNHMQPLQATFLSGKAPKPRPPLPPKRPTTSFLDFCFKNRAMYFEQNPGLIPKDITLLLSSAWNKLPPQERTEYEEASMRNREEYKHLMEKYKRDLQDFHEEFGLDESVYDLAHPDGPRMRIKAREGLKKRVKLDFDDGFGEDDDGWREHHENLPKGHRPVQHMLGEKALPPNVPRLFNKVVTLTPKASAKKRQAWLLRKRSDGSPNTETASSASDQQITMDPLYYFVLTYIPDLRWCRLVALQPKGMFEPGYLKRKGYEKHIGRTRWVLAPESASREIDVSSLRCTAVTRAAPVKNVSDADDEEWDIGA